MLRVEIFLIKSESIYIFYTTDRADENRPLLTFERNRCQRSWYWNVIISLIFSGRKLYQGVRLRSWQQTALAWPFTVETIPRFFQICAAAPAPAVNRICIIISIVKIKNSSIPQFHHQIHRNSPKISQACAVAINCTRAHSPICSRIVHGAHHYCSVLEELVNLLPLSINDELRGLRKNYRIIHCLFYVTRSII